MIKSFCPLNQIIYISHYEETADLPINIFVIEKDTDDWISITPLLKNPALYEILSNITIDNQELNKDFSQKVKQKFSLERIIRRRLNKEYIHSKIYRK